VAGLGKGYRQPPAPHRQLEDRAAGTGGEGQVEVQVTRVVGQVQVVQAGERGRRRGIGPVQP
jgi:hypothetical protein